MRVLHPFHLLTPSVWPLASSLSLFNLAVSLTAYLNSVTGSSLAMLLALMVLVLSIGFWWRDVSQEATWGGEHTFEVKRGLSYGMTLFITTEVLVFFSLFWAYFHSALAPASEFAAIWPPAGVTALDPTVLPLLNTILLLTSGCTVTYAHHALVAGSRTGAGVGLVLTLALAIVFTGMQALEYANSSFTLMDGVYGSAFYVTTGTHGFHVVVGTLFLAVGALRVWAYALTDTHHKSLESAIVYWHMVDVVWLFLYAAVYWWGGDLTTGALHPSQPLQQGSEYINAVIWGLPLLAALYLLSFMGEVRASGMLCSVSKGPMEGPLSVSSKPAPVCSIRAGGFTRTVDVPKRVFNDVTIPASKFIITTVSVPSTWSKSASEGLVSAFAIKCAAAILDLMPAGRHTVELIFHPVNPLKGGKWAYLTSNGPIAWCIESSDLTTLLVPVLTRALSDNIKSSQSVPFQSISFKLRPASQDEPQSERISTPEEVAANVRTAKRYITFGRIRANDIRKGVKDDMPL